MYTQKYIFSIIYLIFFAVLTGCTSTAPRSEYFGYNNSPRLANEQPRNAEENSGSNDKLPRYSSQADGGAYSADYRVYGYIPVIVPWWDGYYNWPGFSHTSARIYYGHSEYYYAPYYPWYSPWYDYNPFYGSAFYYPDHRFWRRPWYCDWQPATTITTQRVGTRNFGSQRGQFTTESGYNEHANSGVVITTGNRVRGGRTEKKVNTQDNIKAVEQPNNGGIITTDNRPGIGVQEKKNSIPDKIKIEDRRNTPVAAPPVELKRETSPTNTVRSTRAREEREEVTTPRRAAEKPQNPQPNSTNSRRRNP